MHVHRRLRRTQIFPGVLEGCCYKLLFTARKLSLGQGNIFSSVCQEFCSQGAADTPPDQAPLLWTRPPPGADPPRADLPRTRHPPWAEHAGRYGQQASGTHPTGMQSCLYKVSLPRMFLCKYNFHSTVLYAQNSLSKTTTLCNLLCWEKKPI